MSKGIGIMRKTPTVMAGWSSGELTESRTATADPPGKGGRLSKGRQLSTDISSCQLKVDPRRGGIRLCSCSWAGTLEPIPFRGTTKSTLTFG